ncbi:hypothetical protein Tco_0134267 [Tanacetum coccineum]
MVDNASGATSMYVPSRGQTTASPAEGEKNTKDAGTNLKDELIDLLGKDVVTQYYTKKLLFDKYYDKMLKIKKNPKITNCEVLTKKGPITLKIYREDGSDEVVSNLKTSVDQLTQTEQELKIDLNQPLKEQDPMNELIDLEFAQSLKFLALLFRIHRRLEVSSHQYNDSGTETEDRLLLKLHFSLANHSS